jgi:hypothetical protein
MILHAIGGLCNRLQAIVSYRSVHADLKVVWQTDAVVSHQHFLDVFDPLHGVEFVKGSWTDEDWDICKGAPSFWQNGYLDLRLREHLQIRVARALEQTGIPFTAMHVRRSDHMKHSADLGGMTPDSAFTTWARLMPGRVFLATDNRITRDNFRASLGDRVVSVAEFLRSPPSEDATFPERLRQTSLEDAAVDLFTCSFSRWFMGSNYSTFSMTADVLRGLR